MAPVRSNIPKTEDDPSTLHLPRILCLHGGGTNATIFKLQCRVLERKLKTTFRFCYAEAPFPSVPGPDVVSVYHDFGPFKAWIVDHRRREFDDGPQKTARAIAASIDASLLQAMAEDDGKGATGEWIGLLGFSQGAKLAASLLYRQQQQQVQKHLRTNEGMAQGYGAFISQSNKRQHETSRLNNFRFAVLLAGRGPFISMLMDDGNLSTYSDTRILQTMPYDERRDSFEGRIKGLDRTTGTAQYAEACSKGLERRLLCLPTLHVHGLADESLDLHRELLERYCEHRATRVVEWDGGHRVPIKTRDVDAVVEEILAMADTTGALSRSTGNEDFR